MAANGSFRWRVCHWRIGSVFVFTADKGGLIIQHALMQLECPHCQANYDIDSGIEGDLFVCHRCGREFCLHDHVENEMVEGALAEGEVVNGEAVDQGVAVEKQPQPPQATSDDGEAVLAGIDLPPVRKKAHIWPWFLTVLILLIGGGFQMQRDAWLDNRWLRSTLTNIGIHLPMRTKDWRIEPESVQPKWISRSDGSKVLFVRGRIENLMRSDMPLPRIQLTFFSKADPRKQLGRTVLAIRLTPSERQLHHIPYIPPPVDRAVVAALGKRGFAIMVESVPGETGDFTLMPALD